MYIYTTVDIYDRNSGKKVGTEKRFDKKLCDFTGDEIDGAEINYLVDYDSIDSCVGNLDAEYILAKAYPEVEELHFMFDPFIFKGLDYYNDSEDKDKLIKLNKRISEILAESDEFFFLEIAFRTIRAETIKRLLDEGKYTSEQFLIN